MDVFLLLFWKLIPLYLLILLGYVAGKKLHVQKETLAKLLIYILAPIVVFDGVLRTQLSLNALSLPFLFLAIGSLLCFVTLKILTPFIHDSRRNILAFTAGTGNTGYFGLPVALAIFGPDRLGLVVLSFLGFILYESTIGFYTVARGNHTISESVLRVLRLPSLYAFLAAVTLNLFNVPLGTIYSEAITNIRGGYTVLGMMIIGVSIGSMERFAIDWVFLAVSFVGKFFIWPAVVLLLIAIDKTYFHFYTPDMYAVMVLMSIVPLAANTVAFATELKTHPEHAALAVLLSTAFALLFIPAFVTLSPLL